MIQAETKTISSSFRAFEGISRKRSKHNEKIYEEAREALDQLGIPSRRTEAWKYTTVNKISGHEWSVPALGSVIDHSTIEAPQIDAYRVYVIDGKVDTAKSDLGQIQGMVLLSISDVEDGEKQSFENTFGALADHRNELFIALNSAFSSGGVYLRIAKGSRINRPVHVIHLNTQTDTAVMTRNVIIAEEGSECHVIHSFVHAEGLIHSNSVSEIVIGDNARLTLDKFQSGTESSYHYSSEETHQGRDATFIANTITIDGAWTRNDPHVRLKGPNSVCYLNGAYLPTGNELVDNHSIIDHLVPHCESHELYKGVVYDQGKGVFNGKVFVRPDAQKTNAFQQNSNIVMSDRASMNSKPELEIYADDVKCSHGSTTGQIDNEALFYLQCRGLDRVTAKQMLVNAFVGEVIEKLHPDLQEYAWARLSAKTKS